jgi:hypothetical protein
MSDYNQDYEKNFLFLNRNLLNNPMWLSQKFTRGQAWVDILMMTNYQSHAEFDVRGIEITLKQGEFSRAEDKLAARWKWHRTTVERFFSALKVRHQIELVRTKPQKVYRILNWEKYQKSDIKTDIRTTLKRHKNDIRTDIFNKENKENKEKIDNLRSLDNEKSINQFFNFNSIKYEMTDSQIKSFEARGADDISFIAMEAAKYVFGKLKLEQVSLSEFINKHMENALKGWLKAKGDIPSASKKNPSASLESDAASTVTNYDERLNELRSKPDYELRKRLIDIIGETMYFAYFNKCELEVCQDSKAFICQFPSNWAKAYFSNNHATVIHKIETSLAKKDFSLVLKSKGDREILSEKKKKV